MRAIPPPYYKRVNYNRDDQLAPYVFTCEHASDYFGPMPIEPENQGLLGTHWALDLGAAELTHALARLSNSVGIMSTYSRLLLDQTDLLIQTPCSLNTSRVRRFVAITP